MFHILVLRAVERRSISLLSSCIVNFCCSTFPCSRLTCSLSASNSDRILDNSESKPWLDFISSNQSVKAFLYSATSPSKSWSRSGFLRTSTAVPQPGKACLFASPVGNRPKSGYYSSSYPDVALASWIYQYIRQALQQSLLPSLSRRPAHDTTGV